MKKIPLLPRYFLWIGLALCTTAVFLYIRDAQERGKGFVRKTFAIISDPPFGEPSVFKIIETDLLLTILILTSLSGLAFIAFSRRKSEDEMINSLRLYAWSWATIYMLAIGFLGALFLYGTTYISFALFIPHILLSLYILIFHLNLSKISKALHYDE